MDLKGKVAVVTGSGGAIGGELVSRLSQEGVKVIALDKHIEPSEKVSSPSPLGEVQYFNCDFADPGDVVELSEKLSQKNQTIDFLFNVAGVGIYKPIKDIKLQEWMNVMDINVNAPFILIKGLLKSLKNVEKGMVFNIGSGMGVIPASDRSSYCTSKFALRGLSLSLDKELKSQNVDVVLLTLGSVMTPFGTGGIDKRKELERKGKKYLTVDEVVDKIISIAKSTTRDSEYTLYPEGYI